MKNKRLLRAGLVCSKNLYGKTDINLGNHLQWIESAIAQGVNFVGFPECSLTGYLMDKNIAISITGKAMKAIEETARENKIYVSVGFLERKGRFFYNSHALFGPSGLVGVMRKMNLTPGEKKFLSSGKRLPVFNIGCAKLGITICADSNGPEISRILSFKGAEIIFAPFATSEYGKEKQSARTFENSDKNSFLASQCCVFYLACNNAGRFEKKIPGEEYLNFSSGAAVLDPEGKKIASSRKRNNRELMIVADIDLAEVDKSRDNSYAFSHFRPEKFYGKLLRNQ